LTRVDDQFRAGAKLEDGELKKAWAWSDADTSALSVAAFQKRLAKQLRAVGCAAEGASYIIHGLLDRMERSLDNSVSSVLAGFFLDQNHCAGEYALSSADKARLKAIRDTSSPDGISAQSNS
jgi:hypothetical protein